jgi:chemotaxis protein methyltransferase CheR
MPTGAINPMSPAPGHAPGHFDGFSDQEFHQLREVIQNELGIAIAPAKRVMVETRVRKRVRALGMESLSQYCRFILNGQSRTQEWPYLIDAITTHKTDFFREPVHFEYLIRDAVSGMADLYGAGVRRPLLVWSSACSTGEEPYTAAMVLSAYSASIMPRSYRFRIFATDISRGVLETAKAAVYPESAIAPVPKELRQRYLLRSRDPGMDRVRMCPAIRSLVEFRQLNLIDRDYGFPHLMDVIFCRNVAIYFDRPTQQKVLGTICRTLQPGGYLFMGHSESLNGLDLPLAQVAPAVYRRLNG